MEEKYWRLKKGINNTFSVCAYDRNFNCQIGEKGIVSSKDKLEGDFCTPSGKWRLVSVYFRPDKINLDELIPNSVLKLKKITNLCGWCNDPTSSSYNKYIKNINKFDFSFENLWRSDSVYDVLIELNYNSQPVIPYKGSAIFIHCSFDDNRNTAGCIALNRNNLIELIKKIKKNTYIII